MLSEADPLVTDHEKAIRDIDILDVVGLREGTKRLKERGVNATFHFCPAPHMTEGYFILVRREFPEHEAILCHSGPKLWQKLNEIFAEYRIKKEGTVIRP